MGYDETGVKSAEVRAIAVEPIGYFRETVHPLVRSVKFMGWFGWVFGLVGIVLSILNAIENGYWGFFVRSPRWFRSPELFEYLAFCHLGLMILLFLASIVVLLGSWVGRRMLITYAYLALILFGVQYGLEAVWLSYTSPGNLMRSSIEWGSEILMPALHGIVFPVLMLVIFRDPVVRRYFEET